MLTSSLHIVARIKAQRKLYAQTKRFVTYPNPLKNDPKKGINNIIVSMIKPIFNAVFFFFFLNIKNTANNTTGVYPKNVYGPASCIPPIK